MEGKELLKHTNSVSNVQCIKAETRARPVETPSLFAAYERYHDGWYRCIHVTNERCFT